MCSVMCCLLNPYLLCSLGKNDDTNVLSTLSLKLNVLMLSILDFIDNVYSLKLKVTHMYRPTITRRLIIRC